MFKKLIEAILDHANEIYELRVVQKEQLDWLKSNSGLATKADLEASEQRIIATLQPVGGIEVAAMSAQLKKSSDALKKAVVTSQPQNNL